MSARQATAIENTERRIAALECSLRCYREGFPAAAAKVSIQLDAAWSHLAELETER